MYSTDEKYITKERKTMFFITPKATEAIIITGGFGKRDPKQPFKVVVGSGTWVIPLLHRVERFRTDAHNVSFKLLAQTKDNVEIKVSATVVFSVERSIEGITRAASKFLNYSDDDIEKAAADVFEGATRGLIGGLSVEQIINDRMELAVSVMEEVSMKMAEFGWKIDSFQINGVTDDNGHIQNLSKPELIRVAENAAREDAASQARIRKAQLEADRDISENQKETDLKTSQNTVETAKARAEAEQSGPLAEAREKLSVTQEQTKLRQAEAELRQAEYEADIVKLAEAESKRDTIAAETKAKATKLEAEALSSSNSVTLQAEMIKYLPEIMESLGKSLANSNLTIVGDDKDITKTLSTLAVSSTTVLNELKKSLSIDDNDNKEVSSDNS